MTREERDALRIEWREGRDNMHVAQRVYFAVPRLLDALGAADARAEKAEADAAAMRAFFVPQDFYSDDHVSSWAGGNIALHREGCDIFRDEDEPCECDCGYADAMDGTAGRALIDEVVALRAQVADLTRERDEARAWAVAAMSRRAERCGKCAGCYEIIGDECWICGGSGVVWVAP